MTMFDEAAWPLIYVTGWIAERDSDRAEPYADPMFDGWRAWRQSQMDSVVFGAAFVTPADRATPAWRALLDTLLNAKIVATGRPLTFRTIVDDRPQPSKVIPGLFYEPRGPYQVVDSIGAREPIPALAWIDAVSPLEDLANYRAAAILRADVLNVWPANGAVKRRGPSSGKTQAVAQLMLAALRAGEDLLSEKHVALAARYGASRDTSQKALKLALSEFNSDK